jgi:cobalamin biosynthesis protein CobD/CbiB
MQAVSAPNISKASAIFWTAAGLWVVIFATAAAL